MPTLLLRNAGWIVTCDDDGRRITNGWILCRDGAVAELGPEPCPHPGADVVRDLEGCIVVPGLINVHHHFFQQLTRAVPSGQRARSLDWLFGMYPLWGGLTPADMRLACLTAGAELLLTGCTTSADHSYLLPEPAMVEAEVEAVAELGLRLHLVRGGMPAIEGDLGRRLGPIMGDRLTRIVDDETRLIPELERDIARFHDAGRLSMLRVDLGPTAITYERPDFMRRLGDMAAAHDLGLHTHFLPRPSERELCRASTGLDTVGFLRATGWLTDRSWFAHSVMLDDSELNALGDSGCGVAHCPRTAIRLGYPNPRIADMRRRGIKVGIGVDGGASNDDGTLLGDLRLGLLLHRLCAGPEVSPTDDWLTPYDALLMATRVGASILRRSDIGHLAPGMAADIAAFDLRSVAYAGAMLDPLGALLMCGADSSSALTVVAGRIVVENRTLLCLDERRLVADANAAAEALAGRAERLGLDVRAYPGR